MEKHSFLQTGISSAIQIDSTLGYVLDVKYVLRRGWLCRPLGVLPFLSRLLGLSRLQLLRRGWGRAS